MIKRSVEGIIPQEYISERTQVVDATVPQIKEKLQVRNSERVHEQIVDVPVPLDQPGDQACRVPADKVVDMREVMQRQVQRTKVPEQTPEKEPVWM